MEIGNGRITNFATLESMLYARARLRRTPSSTFVIECYKKLLVYFNKERTAPYAVQVLGTNGKGSVSSAIAFLAQQYGISTGLFLSPHLASIRERIQYNGKVFSEEAWVDGARCIEYICAHATQELLFFEYIFLLSQYFFIMKNVFLMVMEAGLGGLYDTTSIIPYTVQCYTNISYDHEHILGDTLERITAQKIGSVQKTAQVFSVLQDPCVMHIMDKHMATISTPSTQGSNSVKGKISIQDQGDTSKKIEYVPPLRQYSGAPGAYQQHNMALALQAWHYIAKECALAVSEEEDIVQLTQFRMPGRLQYATLPDIPYTLLIDGSHNPAGMQTLLEYSIAIQKEGRNLCGVLCSFLQRKNIEHNMEILRHLVNDIPLFYMELQSHRALSTADFLFYFPSAHIVSSVEEAFEYSLQILDVDEVQNTSAIFLCTGSLYLVGEVYRTFPSLNPYMPHT